MFSTFFVIFQNDKRNRVLYSVPRATYLILEILVANNYKQTGFHLHD